MDILLVITHMFTAIVGYGLGYYIGHIKGQEKMTDARHNIIKGIVAIGVIAIWGYKVLVLQEHDWVVTVFAAISLGVVYDIQALKDLANKVSIKP